MVSGEKFEPLMVTTLPPLIEPEFGKMPFTSGAPDVEPVEVEPGQHAPRVDDRLGGDDAQFVPPVAQGGQRLGDAGVDLVLEQAHLAVALAVGGHGKLDAGALRGAQQVGQRLVQRGPDEAGQRHVGRQRVPELQERVFERADDAVARVGEGAVQVEEDLHGAQG